MDEVQQFLSETFLDASRYALHSPYLPAMHECDTDIYLVLYAYFKKRALHQKREAAISITQEGAVKLLRHVLLSNLAGQANPPGKMTKSSPPASPWLEYDARNPFGTATFPTITQRSLKEQLQLHKINCESFADILELCRRVEQKVAEGTAASGPPGFGTANVLIFVAVAVALVPSASVEAMVTKLLEVSNEASLPLPLVMRVVHIWCVLDSHNQGGLQRVRDVLHDTVRGRAASGASQVLEAAAVEGLAARCLAGVPPMFMQGQIRLVRPQPLADENRGDAEPDDEEGCVDQEAQRPLAPPRVVTYTEEDTGVPTTAAAPQVPLSPASSDGDIADDEGREFWAQLAS